MSMDVESNVTYITFTGYVEVHKYGFLYFIIMFTVYVVILGSNSTIVCVICMHKSLHEPMYVFIAALLLNSVLFSSSFYPKLLIDVLSREQVISFSACMLQQFFFYSLGGAEFLLLTAMAYDRYVSICRPLQYPLIMRKRTVVLLLLLAWFIPASQVGLCFILLASKKLCRTNLNAIFCTGLINTLHCVKSDTEIKIQRFVILINVALLPGLFIVFTYSRIFMVLYRSSREVRRKAAHTCMPHLIVLINYSTLCIYDVVVLKLETNLSKTVQFVMTLQLFLYHPLLNPIIYGLKMKEIYTRLRRLLCPDKLK